MAIPLKSSPPRPSIDRTTPRQWLAARLAADDSASITGWHESFEAGILTANERKGKSGKQGKRGPGNQNKLVQPQRTPKFNRESTRMDANKIGRPKAETAGFGRKKAQQAQKGKGETPISLIITNWAEQIPNHGWKRIKRPERTGWRKKAQAAQKFYCRSTRKGRTLV